MLTVLVDFFETRTVYFGKQSVLDQLFLPKFLIHWFK